MTDQFKMKVSKALAEARRELKLFSEAHVAKHFGISEETASALLLMKWTKNAKLVSETTFIKIASALRLQDDWIINTNDPNIQKVMLIADMARNNSDCYAIAALPGRCKSEGAREYAKRPEVFHVECNKYFTQRTFLQKILKAMKLPVNDSISTMADTLIDSLNSRFKPLLIIDEADKLQDNVFQFLITFYNDTRGNCGLLLLGSPYFEKRVERGVRMNKQGYAELFSRIGGKFEHLPERTKVKNGKSDAERIEDICKLNGLKEQIQIQEIINTCNNDLRQVKRKVNQFKLRNQLKGEGVLA